MAHRKINFRLVQKYLCSIFGLKRNRKLKLRFLVFPQKSNIKQKKIWPIYFAYKRLSIQENCREYLPFPSILTSTSSRPDAENLHSTKKLNRGSQLHNVVTDQDFSWIIFQKVNYF